MKKKQKAEPESRRKSSYKGNSRNNSKSGGLTFSEKKRLIQLKRILLGKSNEKEKPTTAQRTITFEKMFRDGICQVSHHYYTKMVEFFDINYELLEVDDQADILAQYSKLINYFDPSVKFELVLFNRQVNEQMLTEQFDIPWQEDDFNDIREEYTEMLKKQAAKGNNGIIKSKYLIFGVESNGYKEAKSRLNNIEKDVIRNLNNIGTLARGLDGKERLRILHEYFNQDTMEPFRFSFKDLAESGKSVKTAKETFTKTANAATGIAKKLQEIATKNKTLIITVGIFALLLIMIMSALSSCGSMFTGTVTTTMASTYLSLPAEIDAADLSFTEKEMELQNKIDRIETDYPGYDEYDYNLGAIGHDPYTLISYLSAVHTEFTATEVESEIQELFDAMYSLINEEVEETRTRTVTKTGTRIVTNPDGTTRTEEYEYEEEEEYTVTILRVTLTVTPLESIVAGRMDSEQTEIFGAYTETKGGLQVFASPVDYYWYYYISSYYGYRKNPNTGAEELHRGVDIAVPTGTFVYAAHDGTVTEATYDSYYGNYVVITDSKGYTTKYAHMDSLNVSAGQSVKKGDNIGKSGNTGSSTGSHLHIECLYNGEYYNSLFYFEAGEQTIYGETTGGTGGGTSNVIPPESYDDATVQTLMREANRYLGMPYTFGGTAPASFDCSGFVCWVFSNSGVHNLPRTTAQGIYDQCTPVSAADAKAGDIIFFTGTYNAGRPVTHVGIYCGNGTMVHCGDPIQYTSINTSYWQSHFYGFGRLN